MKVCVVMGGTSAEREVSLKTGRAVTNACRNLGFEINQIIIIIYIKLYFSYKIQRKENK